MRKKVIAVSLLALAISACDDGKGKKSSSPEKPEKLVLAEHYFKNHKVDVEKIITKLPIDMDFVHTQGVAEAFIEDFGNNFAEINPDTRAFNTLRDYGGKALENHDGNVLKGKFETGLCFKDEYMFSHSVTTESHHLVHESYLDDADRAGYSLEGEEALLAFRASKYEDLVLDAHCTGERNIDGWFSGVESQVRRTLGEGDTESFKVVRFSEPVGPNGEANGEIVASLEITVDVEEGYFVGMTPVALEENQARASIAYELYVANSEGEDLIVRDYELRAQKRRDEYQYAEGIPGGCTSAGSLHTTEIALKGDRPSINLKHSGEFGHQERQLSNYDFSFLMNHVCEDIELHGDWRYGSSTLGKASDMRSRRDEVGVTGILDRKAAILSQTNNLIVEGLAEFMNFSGRVQATYSGGHGEGNALNYQYVIARPD